VQQKIKNESRREWLLHQFKYFASKHKRNQIYQVWTHENHPIELHGEMYDQGWITFTTILWKQE
jgi:hypothetical protein